MKQLESLNRVSNIDFDKIILDILNEKYDFYDTKNLVGYNDLYRLRVGGYRIIFKRNNGEVKVLFLGKRGNVYNWLNNYQK